MTGAVYRCTVCEEDWPYEAVRHLARCRACGGGLRRWAEGPAVRTNVDRSGGVRLKDICSRAAARAEGAPREVAARAEGAPRELMSIGPEGYD
jgi:hypothetical protein